MADTSVSIVGNLTDDPELRYTANGVAVANFTVAITARIRDGQEWKDGETSFYNVSVWRDQAENVADSLTKGTRVLVIGTLKQRSWETPEGDKRSRIEITADDVGPALKWATATVERVRRERSPERDPAPETDEAPERPRARARSSAKPTRGRAREAVPSKGGEFDTDAPF